MVVVEGESFCYRARSSMIWRMLSIGNEELLKSFIRKVALSRVHLQQGHSAVWTMAGKTGDKETIDGSLKCYR